MKTTQRRQTLNEVALDLLLAGKEKQLTKLAMAAKKHVEGRVECPDCGDEGPHDHNGDRLDPTFCCNACGMHFSDEGIKV